MSFNQELQGDAPGVGIEKIPEYAITYFRNECFQNRIKQLYKEVYEVQDAATDLWIGDTTAAVASTIRKILADKGRAVEQAFQECQNNQQAQNDSQQNLEITTSDIGANPNRQRVSPFDRRLGRLKYEGNTDTLIIPYDTNYQQSAIDGYTVTKDVVKNSNVENREQLINKVERDQETMRKMDYYRGLPGLVNTYAVTRLYGSKGGQYLLDRPNQRQWYEIDQTQKNLTGFTKNPTTSSIIFWGNGDPYSRTPYHFTDFAFSKYWNKVENNRLITLRRFAAPIRDNMKFPGMAGSNVQGDSGEDDGGTSGKNHFPPMATAVTYFGSETNNNLNDILSFTTGLNWGDVEAKVHQVSTQGGTPGAESGPGGIFPGMTEMAKTLNVAQGNWNADAVLNEGQLPPDPYENGPYENRIIGPVNRINSVKKREPGITYENSIELSFEYVARPIGGVNTKAALLDILSNFLVMGSATAMFWGGQHRFMADPQQYPFLGGDKGIQQWYSGDPVGWGNQTIDSFANNATGGLGAIKDFFSNLFSGGGDGEGFGLGALKSAFSGEGAGAQFLKQQAAKRSSGSIPYLTGMSALLTGEPVGEWHLTVGNPLNPIARIGNLICKSIQVDFGEELGPDDFPTEMKFTVTLEHGMARDRDAIQSIFNRGMGRIYSLPDGFKGAADFETEVDDKTGHRKRTGRNPIYHKVPVADSGTVGGTFDSAATRENAMQGSVSIWNREKFSAVSPNENLQLKRNELVNRSAYRSSNWITKKTLT